MCGRTGVCTPISLPFDYILFNQDKQIRYTPTRLPFPILELHPDNGSKFFNYGLQFNPGPRDSEKKGEGYTVDTIPLLLRR